MLSEKDLQERQAREIEDSKRQLDKTVPGGLTISSDGFYQDSEGRPVDTEGRYVKEPVAAKDVQQAQAEAKAEAERLNAEAASQAAERRAAQERIAADEAKVRADQAATEAKAVKAPSK